MAHGEFERIERLRAIFGEPAAPDVGIGDDAAILNPAGPVIATVDAAVEGVHFRRDLLSLSDASSRAIEAAASDVAAMGGDLCGRGCGLLLAWTLPRSLSDEDFDALLVGARRAADRLSTHIVGGNLASSETLSLTTTALGRCLGAPIARNGARPGDVIAVSGPIGAAALGLRALLSGRGDDPEFAPFIARWRAPRARVDIARDVALHATAAIDISDGLAQDAGHLARASRCGLLLFPEQIPMLEGQRSAAVKLGLEAQASALHGGEDYEVLATGPRARFGAAWTTIGEVIDGAGVFVREGGVRRVVEGRGWDHFAR
ncbi:MAG: thiamine-phosphate kinase [Polyangiales bacterium]